MEFDEMRNSMLASLMEIANGLQPLWDEVDRVKADRVAAGWSPENAEAAALAWLQMVMGAGARG